MLAEPMKHVAPYGSWSAPISAADVAGDSSRLGWLGWVDGELWWTESRPGEGGRVTLMRQVPGADAAVEMLAAPWNVRSRIIEYGGHPWAAATTGAAGAIPPVVVFANWSDQRLYR